MKTINLFDDLFLDFFIYTYTNKIIIQKGIIIKYLYCPKNEYSPIVLLMRDFNFTNSRQKILNNPKASIIKS